MIRIFSLTLAVALLMIAPLHSTAENWPGWRGPRGDGTSLEKSVAVEWDGTTGKNIAWKAALPGRGHASPIVWEDRVFVVSCREDLGERLLLCFDRKTGRPIWQQVVAKTRLEKKHKLNSFASGTPLTDGRLVYVTFLVPDPKDARDPLLGRDRSPGEMVVAAYDFDGKQKWLVRPGQFASVHGYCASPVLYRDTVIVNGDHDGDGYLVALHHESGATKWKVEREHKTRSYSTPILRTIGGREQMILSGDKSVASYDPATGKRHWVLDGPTDQFVASVVLGRKLLFVTAGYPERHMLTVRPDGSGNVTDTHIVWRTRKACSYVPSPIAAGDYFLVVSDNGIATCFEQASGKRTWQQRIGRHYSGSLVSAAGLVYFLDDDGITKIVRPGPQFELVAENRLGEHCYASPAISAGHIFLRSEKHLWCVGQ